MGYNTTFKGVLKFANEPTTAMLAKLNTFFGEDPRKHPEWTVSGKTGYIDLRLTKDFGGIEWDDGCEKTYYLDESVNIILKEMRKEYPRFGLSGVLFAQGEEADDRWELYIADDGLAHRRTVPVVGTRAQCPSCRHKFILESSPQT